MTRTEAGPPLEDDFRRRLPPLAGGGLGAACLAAARDPAQVACRTLKKKRYRRPSKHQRSKVNNESVTGWQTTEERTLAGQRTRHV
jgi:hypothetical protein